MKVTEQQKNALKSQLTEEEYDKLWTYASDLGEFLSALDDLIISRFDKNDENTPEAEKLQCIFDEIYNQND